MPKRNDPLPRLDDPFVATIVLARAASEREAPTSLVQWHDFIARYFALGAALKQAISIFDSGQNACAYTQDRRSCAPEVTSIPLPEHANGASVNSDVTSEVSRRANETEISWEQQRHYALRRRDKRRGLLQKSASGAKFWERPQTPLEQRRFNKKMAKKAQRDATSNRFKKYQKQVEQSKILGKFP